MKSRPERRQNAGGSEGKGNKTGSNVEQGAVIYCGAEQHNGEESVPVCMCVCYDEESGPYQYPSETENAN